VPEHHRLHHAEVPDPAVVVVVQVRAADPAVRDVHRHLPWPREDRPDLLDPQVTGPVDDTRAQPSHSPRRVSPAAPPDAACYWTFARSRPDALCAAQISAVAGRGRDDSSRRAARRDGVDVVVLRRVGTTYRKAHRTAKPSQR
jgi:hypothetical protein